MRTASSGSDARAPGARARSPLFGGATQNGATGAAYPGQFNFWADVRGPPCQPPRRGPCAVPAPAAAGPQALRRSAAVRLLRALSGGSGAARAEPALLRVGQYDVYPRRCDAYPTLI